MDIIILALIIVVIGLGAATLGAVMALFALRD